MEIQIPSPSVFLQRSPVLSATIPTLVKKPTKPRGTAPARPLPNPNVTTTSSSSVPRGEITKPKQSKSRNGCMTCKKKRLKCDETKPTCVQCEKRNVECEGYRKNYKWRSFEDVNKHSRAGRAKKASDAGLLCDLAAEDHNNHITSSTDSNLHGEPQWLPGFQHAFTYAAQALAAPPVLSQSGAAISPFAFAPLPIHNSFNSSDSDLPSPSRCPTYQAQPSRRNDTSHSSSSAGASGLVDVLLPDGVRNLPSDSTDLHPPSKRLPCQTRLLHSDPDLLDGMAVKKEEDFEEEIARDPIAMERMHIPVQQWTVRTQPSTVSNPYTTSTTSTDISIFRAPALASSSPEMLMLRFDRETCGILSVKDGPLENPWRTLVWPLARESEALYHAISSMSALHGAARDPQLRIAGMAHMTKSISRLLTDINQMSLDQALATCLALALGEGWDDKISTGIQHVRGAKALLSNALVQRSRKIQITRTDGEDARRLRFLCNTYVYLDVIARLTSKEEQESPDLDNMLRAVDEPFGHMNMEVDPLMGCATTLFPLIGKVAALVQRIRRTSVNSLNIVGEANELRKAIRRWQPPNSNFVEQPEDESSSVQDAIQTAEAYRRAILLHLHQAVPERSSESSYSQAKIILAKLETTPLSSRTMIVQTFPLLVGSCEMVAAEERQSVGQRWEAMLKRLPIVNVESCWKLVQEVWRRRDAYIAEQTRRLTSRPIGKSMSNGLFIPPSLKSKAMTADAITEEAFFGYCGQSHSLNQINGDRPLRRRLTSDASIGLTTGIVVSTHESLYTEDYNDTVISSLEPEYTVRGYLHWLVVMSDWEWEVFLG